MAEDACIRIVGGEFLQQLIERVLLSIGASISITAFLVQASFIDDAKGTVIVVACMNTLNGFGQQGDNITISADIVMI